MSKADGLLYDMWNLLVNSQPNSRLDDEQRRDWRDYFNNVRDEYHAYIGGKNNDNTTAW